MDWWLIPAGILLIILIILFPIILLFIGIFLLLWAIMLLLNAIIPPKPYLSLHEKGLRINWFVKNNLDSAILITEGNEEIALIDAESKVKNPLTGKYSVCSAAITGLVPGKRYKYKIVKKDTGKKKALYKGKNLWFTFPSKEDAGHPIKICAFGDVQPRKTLPPLIQWLITRKIAKEECDLIMYFGDHTMQGVELMAWIWHFRLLGKIISHVPIIGVAGNHDIKRKKNVEGLTVLDAYQTFLNYPGNKRYYFVRFHGINIFALDFMMGIEPGTEQHDFLKSKTNEMDATKNDWLITFSHTAAYNTLKTGEHIKALREHAVPMLEKAGMNLWLGGHEHAYQRFTVNGVEYITSGATSSFHHHDYNSENMKINVHKYHYVTIEVKQDEMAIEAIPVVGPLIESLKIQKSSIQ